MKTLRSSSLIAFLCVGACLVFSAHCYGFDIIQVTQTPDADEHDCSIAVFGNTVYAIWRDINTAQLWFDKSTDLGRTWGQYTKLIGFSGGYNQEYIQYPNKILAAQNGDLFILYKDGDYLYLLKSPDGGETFVEGGQIPLRIPAQQFDCAIDKTGTILYVVGASSNNTIAISTSTDGGDTFAAPNFIFSNVINNEIKVETTGGGKEVYLFLVNTRQLLINGTQYGWRTRVDFSKSLDSGQTFDLLKGILTEWPGLDASYRHWGSRISSWIDQSGKLYVSWTVKPNWNVTPFTALSTSINSGKTFVHTKINAGAEGADKSSIFLDDAGTVYCSFLKGAYQKVNNAYMFTSANVYFDKKSASGAFGTDAKIAGPLTIPDAAADAIAQVSKPNIVTTRDGHAAFIMWSNLRPGEYNDDLYGSTFYIVNKPPVLNPIGSKVANEGEALDFTVSATDPDKDPLTYSATTLPPGAAFDAETGRFVWTPDYATVKTATPIYKSVKFIVTDGAATDYEIVTIKVSNTNRSPVIEPVGNKSVDENSLLQFNVTASDPDTATDGQKLTYSGINLPSGATINSITGLFQWRPTYKQVGRHVVTLVASDGKLSSADTIEIFVNDVFFPDLDIIEPVTYTPLKPKSGQTVTFTVVVKNNGNEIAGKFVVRFTDGYIYRDVQLTADKTVSQLAVGQKVTLYFTWAARYDSNTVTFYVDPPNLDSTPRGNVIESNEANNVAQVAVPVQP